MGMMVASILSGAMPRLVSGVTEFCRRIAPVGALVFATARAGRLYHLSREAKVEVRKKGFQIISTCLKPGIPTGFACFYDQPAETPQLRRATSVHAVVSPGLEGWLHLRAISRS
jgi:hypothetical protein